MPVVRFSVSDPQLRQLETAAKQQGVALQDYIRSQLFPGSTSIFTPAEAVRRALAKYRKGDKFTLPELYDTAWVITAAEAGPFGRRFNEYVQANCATTIRFVGKVHSDRHAQYEIL